MNCESIPDVNVLPTPPFPDPDPGPTPDPTPTPTPDDPGDSSNTGLIVGLTVAAVVLLAIVAGYCWYKKR